MPRKMMEEKLAGLKSHVLQGSRHLDAGQKQALGERIADLERQLAVQIPLDGAALEEQLLAWELRIAEEHPLMATVIREAIQKLMSLGI